jgi:hypothetical protein
MEQKPISKSGAMPLDDPDLPPVDTQRWVIRRKAQVLRAIEDGRLTRAEACARYNISDAELRLWERAIACAGVPGLRVTRVQIYRPVFEAGEILPSAGNSDKS